MNEPVYAMSWPRALFVWEAHRILQTAPEHKLRLWTGHLLREAFEDDGIAEVFEAKFEALNNAAVWGVPSMPTASSDTPRGWLQALLSDEKRLKPYKPPVYYAERHSSNLADIGPDTRYSFAEDFIELVEEMSRAGYFPKILPKICEDETGPETIDVSKDLRRATKQVIVWPLTSLQASLLPEPTVYSLVEYFNDQA